MAVDSFNTRTGTVVSAGTDYGWTVNGNNVNFALSGNVGIGTTNPGASLEVANAGSLRVNAGSANYPIISLYGYNGTQAGTILGEAGTGSIYYNTGGGAHYFRNANSNYLVSMLNSGNVGIGTNTPSHRLDVAGNVGLSAAAYINFGSVDGATGFGLRDSGGTIQIKNNNQSNWINVQQFLNVNSFGATGTSNDTAVFQAAFDAAASSELYIPAGTYLIDLLTLSNLANVTIRGAGAGATVLRMRSANSSSVMVTVNNCNNFTIRDLTLDGNYPNTSGNAAITISNSLTPKAINVEATGCGPQTSSISLFGCTGGVVKDCHVFGPTTGSNNSHGITIHSCAQCIVAENVLEQQANAGIEIFNSQGISIIGNVCSSTVETSGAGFGGIRLADECYSCSITGNTVNGYGRGIFLAGVIYTTVSGNTIRFCNYEGILVAATTIGNAANTNYNVISNNTIRDPCGVGTDGGIVLAKDTGTNCSGNIIIGNTIVDDRSPARITKALINYTGDTTNLFPAGTNSSNITPLGPGD